MYCNLKENKHKQVTNVYRSRSFRCRFLAGTEFDLTALDEFHLVMCWHCCKQTYKQRVTKLRTVRLHRPKSDANSVLALFP